MKNIVILILCISFLAVSSAQAEQVTLPALKADIPDRLTMTVEGPDGPVVVDAPIILPESDALPILKAGPRHLDYRNIYETMGYLPTEDTGLLEPYLADETMQVLIITKHPDESELYLPPKYGSNANAERLYSLEGTPDNNELPREAPLALMQRVVELSGAQDADVRLEHLLTVSRPYEKKTIRTKDDDAPLLIEPDLDKPFPEPERGYWHANFVQYIDGVRIFDDCYQPDRPTKYGASPASPSGFGMQVQMVTDDDYYLMFGLLEVREQLATDTSLASFDKVRASIEQRIQAGDLLDVHAIELGYMLYREVPMEEMSEEEWMPGMGRYVLSPAWRILGYDVKDRSSFALNRKGGHPTIPEAVDYAYSCTWGNPYAVRIDARTGEFVQSEDFVWKQ